MGALFALRILSPGCHSSDGVDGAARQDPERRKVFSPKQTSAASVNSL